MYMYIYIYIHVHEIFIKEQSQSGDKNGQFILLSLIPNTIKTSFFAAYLNTGKLLSNSSIYLGHIFLVTTSESGIRNIIRYVPSKNTTLSKKIILHQVGQPFIKVWGSSSHRLMSRKSRFCTV